ncbi:MAG: hypothetical protein ACXQTW_03560 [Candidatus Methanospirareceae archaeon]
MRGRGKMSEIRPSIRTLRDVGYRVISKSPDGTPKTVWRCFVKEGQYGKFISIERHFVRRMEGEKIVESDRSGKFINFPYDKEKAFAMLNSIKGLVEDALGAGAGAAELEREVEEEFGEELESFEEDW